MPVYFSNLGFRSDSWRVDGIVIGLRNRLDVLHRHLPARILRLLCIEVLDVLSHELTLVHL